MYSCFISICVSLALALLIGNDGFAGEPEQLGFQDAIKRMSELRTQIMSYDVTITGVVDNKEESVMLTDGSTFVIEKSPIGFTIEMALDHEVQCFLVARKDEYLEKKTGKKITEDWVVYGNSNTWQLARYKDHKSGFIEKMDPQGRLSRPDFFDPTALGLLFPGEFRRGVSVDKIIENYRAWGNDHRAKQLDDDKVRYSRDDHYMVVDMKRGFWPIEMEVRNFNRMLMHAELSVGQVDGQWLPESADVVFPHEKIEVKFEWHAVNKPLPKRFDFQEIINRYGFPIEDHRAVLPQVNR